MSTLQNLPVSDLFFMYIDKYAIISESYFGSRHIGDKRGRGAKWRIPVVGILKRNGFVYAAIIPDASRKTLMPIIEKLVKKSQSNIYTDKWRSYDGLVFSGHKFYLYLKESEFRFNRRNEDLYNILRKVVL